jgi:hypothetical protein
LNVPLWSGRAVRTEREEAPHRRLSEAKTTTTQSVTAVLARSDCPGQRGGALRQEKFHPADVLPGLNSTGVSVTSASLVRTDFKHQPGGGSMEPP